MPNYAWNELYYNEGLATGLNDGTSEANAWQTWDAMAAGVNTGLSAPTRLNATTVDNSRFQIDYANTQINPDWEANANPFWFRGYDTTPGDSGWFRLKLKFNHNLDLNRSVHGITSNIDAEGTKNGASIAGRIEYAYQRSLMFRIKQRDLTSIRMNTYSVGSCIDVDTGGGQAIDALQGGIYNSIIRGGGDRIVELGFAGQAANNIVIGQGNAGDVGMYIANISNSNNVRIRQNTIYNVEDGITMASFPATNALGTHIDRNLFSTISGYVFKGLDSPDGVNAALMITHNAYHAVTSGFSTAYTAGLESGNILLSQDPFVDAAAEDFRLNDVTGGGADCVGFSSITDEFPAHGTLIDSGIPDHLRYVGAFPPASWAGGGGSAAIRVRPMVRID